MMKLTAENYYSPEANKEFLSVSQFKDFAGTLGHAGCEAGAMNNILHGSEPSDAMLVSSFLDRLWEGKTLEEVIEEFPESVGKNGKLKSDYAGAQYMYELTKADPVFAEYMNGSHQDILTGEIDGVPFKIKPDSLKEGQIVDLKYMAVTSIKKQFSELTGHYMDFIRYFGYDIQGAVYQEIVRQKTGKQLPFFLAVAVKPTKEGKAGDHFVVQIPQKVLDTALSFVKVNLERIIKVKTGKVVPERCEKCDFCLPTKKIAYPLTMNDMDGYYDEDGNETVTEEEFAKLLADIDAL